MRTPPVPSAIRPSSPVSPASAAWRSASIARLRRASARDVAMDGPVPLRVLPEQALLAVVLDQRMQPHAAPPPPAVDTSPASAANDPIRRRALRSPVTSPTISGSSGPNSAMSSRNSRSAPGMPRHSRVSIHPATAWSPPAAPAAPWCRALRWMRSAMAHPAESAATALSSRRDSLSSRTARCRASRSAAPSAVTVTPRPSSANIAMSSRGGGSRNAIATWRLSGARLSSAFSAPAAAGRRSRSTSSSTSTHGAPWRASARTSSSSRYFGLAVGARVRRRRRRRRAGVLALAPLAGRTEGGEPGLLEGEGEIGRHRPGVLLVEHQPRDRDALLAQRPAAVGEEGGLAEPAGRVQHRQRMPGQRAARLQLRALHVTLDRGRQPHLAPQQPGRIRPHRVRGLFRSVPRLRLAACQRSSLPVIAKPPPRFPFACQPSSRRDQVERHEHGFRAGQERVTLPGPVDPETW